MARVPPKAPFSAATTPKCRGGGATPFLRLLHLPLIMLSVKQGGINYYFWVFGITRSEIKPQTIGEHSNHYVNVPYIYIYIYIRISDCLGLCVILCWVNKCMYMRLFDRITRLYWFCSALRKSFIYTVSFPVNFFSLSLSLSLSLDADYAVKLEQKKMALT